MKKHITSISAALLATATLYAASARLDFVDNTGTLFSILEQDLIKLTYLSDDATSGNFTKINIETTSGQQTIDITDQTKIVYAPATGTEPFAIDIETDGHCTVTMLDCLNNDGIIDPTKPFDWHGAESDYLGHFIYSPEYGYEMEVSITGQYTGKVYSENPGFIFFVPAEDYAKWTDSWGFLMPNEPITLKGTSTEFTTYEGKEFVGLYNGYEIRNEPRLSSPDETSFTLDLRANGSYVVTTTDDNAFDFHFMYTYDETAGKFLHVPVEQPKWDNTTQYYGANSTALGNGLVYVEINNYTSNKEQDRRFYLASKTGFTFTCAASDYGQKHLIESSAENAGKTYVFTDNYGAKVTLATLDFKSGTSIAEPCEAIISYEGDTRLKYVNNGTDNPQFINKGLEAGTYTPADGTSTGNLVLDGFGEATIDGENHPYTVSSGVVTFTDDSMREFSIEVNARTYTEITVNDPWTGPAEFIIENASGACGGTESDKCRASVKFDQTLNGSENPGYIALKIEIWDSSYGSMRDMISSNPKYIYNREAATITLSGVLVGTGTGFNSERRNLVLRVADDLKSVWFDETLNGDRIYGTSSPSDYFYTGTRNTLTAPSTAPVIAGTYTAEFSQSYYFGSPTPVPSPTTGKIALDKGYSNVDKPGYAYFEILYGGSQKIYNDVVEYELTDTKLILKNIDVGDSSFNITPGNLEFDITPEGNLQGHGVINGNTMSTVFNGVDLDSGTFTPEATE